MGSSDEYREVFVVLCQVDQYVTMKSHNSCGLHIPLHIPMNILSDGAFNRSDNLLVSSDHSPNRVDITNLSNHQSDC